MNDNNKFIYKDLSIPAWIIAGALSIFIMMLLVTFFTGHRITFNPFGWIKDEPIHKFKVITLTKEDFYRNSDVIRVFVETQSVNNYVICQTRSAGDYPKYIKEIFCHPSSQRGKDGILIHVQLTEEPVKDFYIELLVYQESAKNYDSPVLLR